MGTGDGFQASSPQSCSAVYPGRRSIGEPSCLYLHNSPYFFSVRQKSLASLNHPPLITI